MKAMILAAGYGTRLADVIKDTPKPLILINGKPLIDYIILNLQGIPFLTEVVVITNNRFFAPFQEWAQTPACPASPLPVRQAGAGGRQAGHSNLKIRIVNDGTHTPEERLGSVGDINFVWKSEQQLDDWLIIGGDNLFDRNLVDFMRYALKHAPAITIGAYDIRDKKAAVKFGVIALDANNKVISFEEKPANPKSSLITMCLYYFPKNTLDYLFEYLSQSQALDAAGSYIQWLSQKKNVYGFQFSGKWYDIGSIESLNEAKEHFK